jgi:hypothetical protein
LYAVAVTAFLVAFSAHTVWSHHHKQQKDVLSCSLEDHGKLFPKADNCSEFYQCSGGVLFTLRCQEDLYYCAEKEYCDYIDNCDYSNCKLNPDNKTLHDSPIAEGTAFVPECPDQVDKNVTFIVNPENCSNYYECDNGVPVLMECPDTLYFCIEKEACVWQWEPNCSFNCQAVRKEPLRIDDYIENIMHFKNHDIEVKRSEERQVPKGKSKKSSD